MSSRRSRKTGPPKNSKGKAKAKAGGRRARAVEPPPPPVEEPVPVDLAALAEYWNAPDDPPVLDSSLPSSFVCCHGDQPRRDALLDANKFVLFLTAIRTGKNEHEILSHFPIAGYDDDSEPVCCFMLAAYCVIPSECYEELDEEHRPAFIFLARLFLAYKFAAGACHNDQGPRPARAYNHWKRQATRLLDLGAYTFDFGSAHRNALLTIRSLYGSLGVELDEMPSPLRQFPEEKKLLMLSFYPHTSTTIMSAFLCEWCRGLGESRSQVAPNFQWRNCLQWADTKACYACWRSHGSKRVCFTLCDEEAEHTPTPEPEDGDEYVESASKRKRDSSPIAGSSTLSPRKRTKTDSDFKPDILAPPFLRDEKFVPYRVSPSSQENIARNTGYLDFELLLKHFFKRDEELVNALMMPFAFLTEHSTRLKALELDLSEIRATLPGFAQEMKEIHAKLARERAIAAGTEADAEGELVDELAPLATPKVPSRPMSKAS